MQRKAAGSYLRPVEWIIVIVYVLILAFITYRYLAKRFPFFSRHFITALFLLKALAAIYYGLWHKRECGQCDTFLMFKAGNYIYDQLKEDPGKYFLLTFGPNGGHPHYLDESDLSAVEYWGNTASYTVVRFNALIRPFSFGYYAVHSLFMAFFSFLALLYLFRYLCSIYPEKKKLFVLILFLVPSVVFYGSGVHKEAIALIALSLIVPSFGHFLNGRRRALFLFLPSLFLLYLVKEFYFASLLPALLAWGISQRSRLHPGIIFTVTVLLFWAAVFLFSKMLPVSDLARQMAEKQELFRATKGASHFVIPPLDGSLASILKALPGALFNVFVRPLNGGIHSPFLFFYALENMAILLLTLWTIVSAEKMNFRHPLFWFFFLFSLASLLIIGLIVPNIGAISRYRVPGLLFYLLALAVVLRAPARGSEKDTY